MYRCVVENVVYQKLVDKDGLSYAEALRMVDTFVNAHPMDVHVRQEVADIIPADIIPRGPVDARNLSLLSTRTSSLYLLTSLCQQPQGMIRLLITEVSNACGAISIASQ